MQRFNFLLLNIVLIASPFALAAQVVTSVAPSAAMPGQTINVVIRGNGTHFLPGATTVHFGAGIAVVGVSVKNAETAVATLSIDNNAVQGFRSITIATGPETVLLPNGFEVFSASAALKATLQVLPAESISISDVDVTNPANLPIFFFVNIYNNNVVRKINVNLFFSSGKKGLLGRVYRNNLEVAPNQTLTINQKDFDQFQRGPSTLDLYKEIRGLGAFPADEYTYRLEIRSDRGQLLATDVVVTTIANPKYNPELIYPGNNFSQQTDVLYTPFPLFQWYGQNDRYDFALYKLMPGQTAEEAVRNLFVFRQNNIIGTNFTYPVFAEPLIDGQAYAWQVRGKYNGAKGEQVLPSEVFRFVYRKNVAPQNAGLAGVRIVPQQIQLNAGQQYQFNAEFFNSDNIPLSGIAHQWQVTPQKASINQNGLFTAGKESATVAVLLKAGSTTDFATVTIKGDTAVPFFNLTDWDIEKVIRLLFGLDKKN